MTKSKVFSLLASLMILFNSNILAQEILTPRLSPFCELTQYVGVSKITITYSRPGVKEREIWGGLVPYDQIWRTGANENTTIEFSDPVTINGNKLDAGKYGLHTIPGKEKWIVIFSFDNDKWGSMNYAKQNDALRIEVTPEEHPFAERLTIDVEHFTDRSADVAIFWEKLKVCFKVEFDTPNIVIQNIAKTVNWTKPLQAANYVLENDLEPKTGIHWVDISIAIEENYHNLKTKAQLLNKLSRNEEAIEVLEKALTIAEKDERPPYDYEEFKQLLEEWKNK